MVTISYPTWNEELFFLGQTLFEFFETKADGLTTLKEEEEAADVSVS